MYTISTDTVIMTHTMERPPSTLNVSSAHFFSHCPITDKFDHVFCDVHIASGISAYAHVPISVFLPFRSLFLLLLSPCFCNIMPRSSTHGVSQVACVTSVTSLRPPCWS